MKAFFLTAALDKAKIFKKVFLKSSRFVRLCKQHNYLTYF